MNVLTFPFWKVFSHLSCPLCHMYYSLICDTSSPYSTFLACTLSFDPQQLFSTIHDRARSTGHFHTLWPVKSQSHVSLSPSSTLSPSKKSVRHSRATLKLPSCFISQITKVSKVSQRGRDSLSKGGMQTDLSVYEFYKYLLWGSYCPIAGCQATKHNAKSQNFLCVILYHLKVHNCVMCVLHMMAAAHNVFLAREACAQKLVRPPVGIQV